MNCVGILTLVLLFAGIGVAARVSTVHPSPVAAQQITSDDEHLIVPGERIGRVNLGANATGLLADFLGAGSCAMAGTEPESKVVAYYCVSKDSTEVVGAFVTAECKVYQTLSKCRILEVFTPKPNYATVEGLHVGILETQVRDALGEPARTVTGKDAHSLLYANGILFLVNEKPGDDYQKVMAIWVRPRNCLEVVRDFQADYPCH